MPRIEDRRVGFFAHPDGRVHNVDVIGIRAVQLAQAKGQFRIERIFCSPMRRSTDRPDELLKTLVSQHGFDRCPTAVALPHQNLSFRHLETELENIEQVCEKMQSTLEQHHPLCAEDAVFDACTTRELPGNRHSCLVTHTLSDSRCEWATEGIGVDCAKVTQLSITRRTKCLSVGTRG